MQAIEFVTVDGLIHALRAGDWPPIVKLPENRVDKRLRGVMNDGFAPEGALPLSRVHSRRKSGLPKRIQMDPYDDDDEYCDDYDDNNRAATGGARARDPQREGEDEEEEEEDADTQEPQARHKDGEPHARRGEVDGGENQGGTDNTEAEDDEATEAEGDEYGQGLLRTASGSGRGRCDDAYVQVDDNYQAAEQRRDPRAAEGRSESNQDYRAGDAGHPLKTPKPRSRPKRKLTPPVSDAVTASLSTEAQGKPRLSIPAGMERLLSKCNLRIPLLYLFFPCPLRPACGRAWPAPTASKESPRVPPAKALCRSQGHHLGGGSAQAARLSSESVECGRKCS